MALSLICSSGFIAPATAMNISIHRLGFRAIFAQGAIVNGDAERLRIALRSADGDEPDRRMRACLALNCAREVIIGFRGAN